MYISPAHTHQGSSGKTVTPGRPRRAATKPHPLSPPEEEVSESILVDPEDVEEKIRKAVLRKKRKASRRVERETKRKDKDKRDRAAEAKVTADFPVVAAATSAFAKTSAASTPTLPATAATQITSAALPATAATLAAPSIRLDSGAEVVTTTVTAQSDLMQALLSRALSKEGPITKAAACTASTELILALVSASLTVHDASFAKIKQKSVEAKLESKIVRLKEERARATRYQDIMAAISRF